ncbi:MAG TPA: hypothetical protein VGD43_23130, partial [Micromonospora sp.]
LRNGVPLAMTVRTSREAALLRLAGERVLGRHGRPVALRGHLRHVVLPRPGHPARVGQPMRVGRSVRPGAVPPPTGRSGARPAGHEPS